jgi:hypothetical protein
MVTVSVVPGEPLSYEEGHALNRWLGANASVDGVWYGWGGYLWAPACSSGVTNADICYVREDHANDRVHPSATGQGKVSAILRAEEPAHVGRPHPFRTAPLK